MITCRRATKNDVALFREVRLKALKESPEAFGSTYEASLQRDVRSWEEQLWATTSGGDRNTQFAFDDEECIGIAALYREGAAPSGEVLMMWVDPSYRGSSAATMLVEELLRWAKGSEFAEVNPVVSESNARAIRFYEKLGFQDTGEKVEVDANRDLIGIRMAQEIGKPQ